MTVATSFWCFANYGVGYYEYSDWDTATILDSARYYFKQAERNRKNVSVGDVILLRQYGAGFWGTCEIAEEWISDDDAVQKHEVEAGWFSITNVDQWDVTLPFEVIRSELTNQDHRSRITRLEKADWDAVQLARRIYVNLGYGATDGEFFVVEDGLEEAVKANLSQLGLVLAEEEIQQQYHMGVGVGRSDLICRDSIGNFVVLEL